MRILLTAIIILQLGFGYAQGPNPTQLIEEMQAAIGGSEKLYALKDVQFEYDYFYPNPGIRDVSTERYIFDGEHSWAKYNTHQINVMPKAEGEVIQTYVNSQPAISLNGQMVEDKAAMGGTEFLRKANYFWFTMNFKLNDPGTQHEYLGEEKVDGTTYHKVKVTYDSGKTGKEKNDGYILYLNKETKLVDQFFFSLPAQGVDQIAIKMKVEYKDMNGIKVPAKRYIYMPGKDGKPGSEPGLIQTSTNITFDNGFKPDDFRLGK